MLREESTGIAIVGLGDAQPTTSDHAKMKELQKLLLILSKSLKRKRDGNHTWSFLDIHPGAGLSRFRDESSYPEAQDLPVVQKSLNPNRASGDLENPYAEVCFCDKEGPCKAECSEKREGEGMKTKKAKLDVAVA
jgi:hypothetical protein